MAAMKTGGRKGLALILVVGLLLSFGTARAQGAPPSTKDLQAAVHALGADSFEAREEAARSLEAWGRREPGRLLGMLPEDSADLEIRIKLEELRAALRVECFVEGLGLKDERLLASARDFLSAPSEETMAAFARGPGRECKDEILHALTALHGHPDPLVRRLCVQEPLVFGDPRALRAFLQDPDRLVRGLAATGFLQMKDPDSVQVMLRFIGDRDPFLAEIGLIGLSQLRATTGVEGILKAMEKHPKAREVAFRTLGQLKAKEALPAVVGYLRSELPADRIGALNALGAIGDPGSAGAVAGLLDDPLPRIQETAAFNLGRLLGKDWKGDPDGVAFAKAWRATEREGGK